MQRSDLKQSRCIVVKIGSTLLTDSGRGLDRSAITAWVGQIVALRRAGAAVVLVSSGSVTEGMCRLGWRARPQALHQLQAAASVGQMGLIQAYESCFQQHDMHTAQLLLTHDDLSDRRRYLNARNTLMTLLELGVVPVVNENDVVATEEIRFGDNDTLAALVANLIEADLLVLLTDQQGLFDRDPGLDPRASLISEAKVSDPRLAAMAGESRSGLGRGGMSTKLRAARLAARSGTATIIAAGAEQDILAKIIDGHPVGTLLIPDLAPLLARKRWLAGQLQIRGQLLLDRGAVKVLKTSGKSLLPVGVTEVTGAFERGELVACVDAEGHEVARGLVNYNAIETEKIKQQPSSMIESLLGYVDQPELIHRDNLVLTDEADEHHH